MSAKAVVVVAEHLVADGEAIDVGAHRVDDPGELGILLLNRASCLLSLGRVDVALLADGSALVAWVERTGGDGSDVRLRRVGPGGGPLETLSATAPFSALPQARTRLLPTTHFMPLEAPKVIIEELAALTSRVAAVEQARTALRPPRRPAQPLDALIPPISSL